MISVIRRTGSKAASFALLGLLLVGYPGCDTGSRNDDTQVGRPGGPGTGPRPPGGLTAPIFFSLSDNDATICVGDVITIIGVNFSPNLGSNEVIFRSGQSVVQGTPIGVTFPTDTNPRDGIDSRLQVLVPTGVISGTVELVVNGVQAGGRGFLACPMVYGYTIGIGGVPPDPNAVAPGGFAAIQHNGILGYDPQFGPETLLIHGINFDEVNEVRLRDSQGNRAVLTNALFQRRNITPGNGMDTILFSLEGIRFAIRGDRDNIFCQVGTPTHLSNEITVPQQTQQAALDPDATLGPAINGVNIPTGVRNGPVRLDYSFYDSPPTMSYRMIVEWTVDRGQTWFPARTPAFGVDPRNDGDLQVGPGSDVPFAGALPSPALRTPTIGLIRGFGAIKTFTWDADRDPNFRNLNNAVGGGGSSARRGWTVSFRIAADPMDDDGGNRTNPGVLFHTPPVAYFDLENRTTNDPIASQRQGSFLETFDSRGRAVTDCSPNDNPFIDECNTAIWGPDNLEARISSRPPRQFGNGTRDLVLELLEEPGTVDDEFYLVDTNRLQIDRVVVTTPPGQVDPDVTAVPVFPNLLAGVTNPGSSLGEFHLRTLTIGPGARLDSEGNRPLLVKLSGTGQDLEVVFRHEGDIIANGVNGGEAGGSDNSQDAPPGTNWPGGRGILGSGAGGNGSRLQLDQNGRTLLALAARGGLCGGFGGESPALVGPDSKFLSRTQGGPGGGGGSRLRGNDGSSGDPTPTIFKPAVAGRGGPKRGESTLVRLVPGSGGGGGGIGTTRRPNPQPPLATSEIQLTDGGGGGSGGGAVKISGLGSFVITGTIQVNGGNGADPPGGRNGGPGGGGSGGCIFLECTGFTDVGCDNLRANGGVAGSASQINSVPESGKGAAGWIRVSTRFGGVPFCGSLASAETTLRERLTSSDNSNRTTVKVVSTAAFPDAGTLVVGDELIRYTRKTADSFADLRRGARGTSRLTHEVGRVVALYDRPVLPPAALGGLEMVQPAAEPPNVRNGLDEVLQCFFIESINPETGTPLRDSRGRILSIWTFNTDTGVVRDPRGAVVKTAVGARTQPGVLQLTRLLIDAGVTLRGVGSRPMQLLVTELADIAGHLDVNGQDGGLLVFDSSRREAPEPGAGGRGGPGGGNGGNGGTIVFLNGNPGDRTESNVDVIHGQNGFLPFAINGSSTPVPVGDVRPASGGLAQRDSSCEDSGGANLCAAQAGGGGGGGHRSPGSNGTSQPPNTRGGTGGDPFGEETLRRGGSYELVAGAGGAGGGPSLARSADYVGKKAGPAVFQGAANYGPGTGGGGGGGVLRLAVNGALILRETARVTANGGSAFQSIDLAGNGGAGSGGTIFIQVGNAITIEQGARIEARGGRANLPVPLLAGQTVPSYEGNIRAGNPFGGLGGNGSPGRVRIEAVNTSNVLRGGNNPSIVGGLTLLDVEKSVAFSQPFRLGIGPGRGVLTQDLVLRAPVILSGRFGQPTGTRAVVLWEAARQSTDFFGETGPFCGGVTNLADLVDYDFVRFIAVFEGNTRTFETPVIREIRATYDKAYLPAATP